MPMYDEYREQNKSDVADIKNTGGRFAGAITAAQFIAELVIDDDTWNKWKGQMPVIYNKESS